MIESLLAVMQVAITAGQDGGITWILAIGPAGAVGLYWMLFRFYRNTDKSHGYERETSVTASPVTGDETKVGENNGTKETEIRGRNEQKFRKRVQRVP